MPGPIVRNSSDVADFFAIAPSSTQHGWIPVYSLTPRAATGIGGSFGASPGRDRPPGQWTVPFLRPTGYR